MKLTTRIQLSAMMFMQFFIWGGWFVTLSPFLTNNFNASGSTQAMIFSTQSWGAIIAPFIIGLIADRFFNAEKILGVLHIIGAILMFQMYKAENVDVFYPYVLLYMILYMPTIALVNSVSFKQMNDPEKEFSNVRVFGTIGWVVAGLLISYLFGWDSKTNAASGLLKNTFLMTSIVSLMLGLFSFSLPKTPPTKSAGGKISLKEIIGLDAMKLLKDRNFFIFFISSILICIPLAFYYQVAPDFISNIGVKNPTGKMAIGQISEILFMLLLPVFFSKFGFKRTILVGMAAWAIRYVLFAFGNAGDLSFMLLIGIALHGVCYDFFFVSGYIYTNSKAGEKYKSAAQGLITLATYGVGMLIGFAIAGMITDSYKISDKVFDYKMVWLIPSAIALGVFLIFTVFFKDEKNKVLKPGQIN